ncbi:type II toxin-antitoxin system VapC family toxin [Candidatus Woesearchaeota archaeon]|nr:type II toxin-antitoxin system VapC family toxin [Candidatus Woesearchaeota archaeon]
MMYSLDTNIIVDILRGDTRLKSKLQELNDKQINCCITPIVLAELFKGVYKAQRQSEALKLVEDFVQNLQLLDFNEYACRLFGQRHAELLRLGKQTQELDLMIASISLAHDAIVVTNNHKDFHNIRGLKIESW